MKEIMKKMKNTLFAFVFLFTLIGKTDAQPELYVYDGPNYCVGSQVWFGAINAGKDNQWDFNGEGQSKLTFPKFTFKTAGNKTITFSTIINGTRWVTKLNLVILELPTIKVKLQSPQEQCFENNVFCFTDSSFNQNGAKIAKVRYSLGDGQHLSFNQPTMPQNFCFSLNEEKGGEVPLYIEIEDEKGCVNNDVIYSALKIREKIGARFTIDKPMGCDSVIAKIDNVTRIDKSKVKKITWYWGDGSTSSEWGPTLKKTFDGKGVYNPAVAIETLDGCKDSFTVMASRLNIKFGFDAFLPSCNTIIDLHDSSTMFDPCSWIMKNCNSSTTMQCDFINEWLIDWGDGRKNVFKRDSALKVGLPDRIIHEYTRNGWFKIQYHLKTNKGSEDSISRWIKITGPRPKFNFTDFEGNEAIIYAGDSIQVSNLSDTPSRQSDWTWFWGDGKIYDTREKDRFLWHTYKKPGKYLVFLQQYDSLIFSPTLGKYCPATFPDTPTQKPYIVIVLPRDTQTGFVSQPVIPNIDVFPNPSRGEFEIKMPSQIIQEVEIFSSDGRLVWSERFISNQNSQTIKLNEKPGIYFMRINEAVWRKIEIVD